MLKNIATTLTLFSVSSALSLKARDISSDAGLISGIRGDPLSSIWPRDHQLSPVVTICPDGLTDGGCVGIPTVSDECINFTGGLTFLDKAVSSAVIPGGYVCTFYSQPDCVAGQGDADQVFLSAGSWSMFNVPGITGTVNFNDKARSFVCSPL